MKEIDKLFKFIEGKNTNEVKKYCCDKLIGQGCYRDVYSIKGFPNHVIKIERDMTSANFANAMEWRNWINNKEWKWFAKFLAPCQLISATGQVLVQSKVVHKETKRYPKQIPSMFTDVKYENFGWINNKLVCCDYSFIPFYIIKVGNSRFKKAKWIK